MRQVEQNYSNVRLDGFGTLASLSPKYGRRKGDDLSADAEKNKPQTCHCGSIPKHSKKSGSSTPQTIAAVNPDHRKGGAVLYRPPTAEDQRSTAAERNAVLYEKYCCRGDNRICRLLFKMAVNRRHNRCGGGKTATSTILLLNGSRADA